MQFWLPIYLAQVFASCDASDAYVTAKGVATEGILASLVLSSTLSPEANSAEAANEELKGLKLRGPRQVAASSLAFEYSNLIAFILSEALIIYVYSTVAGVPVRVSTERHSVDLPVVPKRRDVRFMQRLLSRQPSRRPRSKFVLIGKQWRGQVKCGLIDFLVYTCLMVFYRMNTSRSTRPLQFFVFLFSLLPSDSRFP